MEIIIGKENAVKEISRLNVLMKRYKKQFPKIEALWDYERDSIEYNDMNAVNLNLYKAPLKDLLSGLHNQSVFFSSTLWTNIHLDYKITKVIEAWENKKALTPIHLVKHGREPIGLVSDGKHRLTVSVYLNCVDIPFMVESNKCDWVLKAIPSAKIIQFSES